MSDPNQPSLTTGDIVVPLAPLSTQCAAISGSLATGLGLYFASNSWVLIAVGLLVGAVSGAVMGKLLGWVMFPSASGTLFVVRAGKAAVPLTLQAALVPSVLIGLGFSLAIALVGGAPLWPEPLLSGAVVALAVGLLFGFGAALA